MKGKKKTDRSTVFSISIMLAQFCFRLDLCAAHIRFILPPRLSIFPKPTWSFCSIWLHLSTSSGKFLCIHLFAVVTQGALQLSPWHLYHFTAVVVTLIDEGQLGMKCASITLYHNPFWAVAFCSSGSQKGEFSSMHLSISVQYVEYIKFSIEDNAHSGQSDDASVDAKLSLAYLYLMQYMNTAQLSEGHEQSSVRRGNFCRSHSLSWAAVRQWAANLGVNLVMVPCEQSDSLWSCGHWTFILLFTWHAVKTASWWPSFSIVTSKVFSHGTCWIESFVRGAAFQVRRRKSCLKWKRIHKIQRYSQSVTDIFELDIDCGFVTAGSKKWVMEHDQWQIIAIHLLRLKSKVGSNDG